MVICDICNKTLKGNLTRHKANIHKIGVKWKKCDVPGCSHMSKHTSDLKKHKENIHDIGVKWNYCDEPGCSEKFKQNSNLK